MRGRVCAALISATLSQAHSKAIGTYRFESDEELRSKASKIAHWFSLIRAKPGDTVLHLALRINGADDVTKVELVTELVGHGFDFQHENDEGELPAVLDKVQPPARSLAYLSQ